jgi:hypothetical protein
MVLKRWITLMVPENASVDLYYDDSKKFETTSTGVTVTGSIDLLSNGGVLLNGGLALCSIS